MSEQEELAQAIAYEWQQQADRGRYALVPDHGSVTAHLAVDAARVALDWQRVKDERDTAHCP